MIGNRIKEYLISNGIKQVFLVEKTGMTASKISDICNHNRKIDCIEYYKICKALNLDLNYFFEQTEQGAI